MKKSTVVSIILCLSVVIILSACDRWRQQAATGEQESEKKLTEMSYEEYYSIERPIIKDEIERNGYYLGVSTAGKLNLYNIEDDSNVEFFRGTYLAEGRFTENGYIVYYVAGENQIYSIDPVNPGDSQFVFEADGKIDSFTIDSVNLFYHQGNSIFRVHLPSKTVDKILDEERIKWFSILSNSGIQWFYENPEWTKYVEQTDDYDGKSPDAPNIPMDYLFVYNHLTKENKEITADDVDETGLLKYQIPQVIHNQYKPEITSDELAFTQMSYEEYYSNERFLLSLALKAYRIFAARGNLYIENPNREKQRSVLVYGGVTSANTIFTKDGYITYYLKDGTQIYTIDPFNPQDPELFFHFEEKMDCFIAADSVNIFCLQGKTVYRLHIPSKTIDKIFEDEKIDPPVRILSNSAINWSYPNPKWLEYVNRTGDAFGDNLDAPKIPMDLHFIYNHMTKVNRPMDDTDLTETGAFKYKIKENKE